MVGKETRKFRHSYIVAFLSEFFIMGQTESEMMLQSSILWFKFVRVIQV
jgi:hypothetical protein